MREEKLKLVKEGKIKKEKNESRIYRKDGGWFEYNGKKDVGIEVPFNIPQNWSWARLNDVSNIIMGQSPDGNSVNTVDGVEFHQGKKAFSDRYLTPSGFFTSCPTRIIETGTIVICVRAPVGDVNIVTHDVCIGRGLAGVKPLCVDGDFLFYVLSSFKSDLESVATGTIFKAVSSEQLKDLLIPISPLSEQERIVAKIEELKTCTKRLNELMADD